MYELPPIGESARQGDVVLRTWRYLARKYGEPKALIRKGKTKTTPAHRNSKARILYKEDPDHPLVCPDETRKQLIGEAAYQSR